jgi:cell division initiation protein
MLRAINPDEIERASFSTAFRGYEPQEVHDYLRNLAEGMRAAIAEAQESAYENLGEDIGRLLQNAKETADDIVAKAQEKANMIDAETRRQASKMRKDIENHARQMREATERETTQRVEQAKAEIVRLSEAEAEVRDRIDALRAELEEVSHHLARALQPVAREDAGEVADEEASAQPEAVDQTAGGEIRVHEAEREPTG